jgi:hypothetical protein
MKEVRIIVEGDNRPFVTDLLEKVRAHRVQDSRQRLGQVPRGALLFNDTESLVMIMTVGLEEKVEPILAGLRPLFERHSA